MGLTVRAEDSDGSRVVFDRAFQILQELSKCIVRSKFVPRAIHWTGAGELFLGPNQHWICVKCTRIIKFHNNNKAQRN